MERMAWRVLTESGLTSAPVDIFALCKKYASVYSYTQGAKEDWRGITCDYTLLHGFTAHRPQQCPLMMYNDTLPEVRVRFTLAHEMAHLLLEHRSHGERFVFRAQEEQQADLLAGMLLMPFPLLRKYQAQEGRMLPALVGEYFRVSRQAAAYRLQTCTLLQPSPPPL